MRTGFVTPEWHEAPPVRIGDGYHVVFRARTPVVRWVYELGPRGDFARWVLDSIRKYEKQKFIAPWLPEEYTDFRVYRVSFIERLGALALAVYIVCRAVVR